MGFECGLFCLQRRLLTEPPCVESSSLTTEGLLKMFSVVESRLVLLTECKMPVWSCPKGGAPGRETKLRVFPHLLCTSTIWAHLTAACGVTLTHMVSWNQLALKIVGLLSSRERGTYQDVDQKTPSGHWPLFTECLLCITIPLVRSWPAELMFCLYHRSYHSWFPSWFCLYKIVTHWRPCRREKVAYWLRILPTRCSSFTPTVKLLPHLCLCQTYSDSWHPRSKLIKLLK